MKIAFLHTKNFFTSELLRHIRTALAHHEVVEWLDGRDAPAFDFDVLLAMSNVGRELLLVQPKLTLVQTASDGYEDVDIDAASELGIWVSYAPADLTGNATSVAEFAVLLLLGAARHLGEALISLRGGTVRPPTLSLALSGKTVCIIGLGTIGLQLVDRLRPFGVKMIATDEHPENAPADVSAYPADQLNTAVADADFVVICVRASKDNENLIDAAALAAMKRGAILVNIARGMLIDEAALVHAVTNGQLSAAGLDVLKNEPPDRKGRSASTPPSAGHSPHCGANRSNAAWNGELHMSRHRGIRRRQETQVNTELSREASATTARLKGIQRDNPGGAGVKITKMLPQFIRQLHSQAQQLWCRS